MSVLRRGCGNAPAKGASDFMGTGTADKHLGERLGYLWFIAIVAFEHLAVKRSFSISGDFEIFNASRGSHQITSVGAIAIPTTMGRAFSPRCSNTLLQFFTHDLFDQHLDGTDREAT